MMNGSPKDLANNAKHNPQLTIMISGKRKAGKDYFASELRRRFGTDTSVVMQHAAPIKLHWATTHLLDFAKLLETGTYKEQYRKDMVSWGETVRDRDIGFFCREAIKMFGAERYPLWIASDVRRKTDVEWYRDTFGAHKVIVVRVNATLETRHRRGFEFVAGIDDAATECQMDSFDQFNYVVENNETEKDNRELERVLDELCALGRTALTADRGES